MNWSRAFSSPDLVPPLTNYNENPEECDLEGDFFFLSFFRFCMYTDISWN